MGFLPWAESKGQSKGVIVCFARNDDVSAAAFCGSPFAGFRPAQEIKKAPQKTARL